MKLLILGKDSYLGNSLKEWLGRWPDKYRVDSIGTKDGSWRQVDFHQYNTVVNFAGIAHINNITSEMEGLFYSVNRDLAIEMCQYAKRGG